MIRVIKHIYLSSRFFMVFGIIILLYFISYAVKSLFPITQTLTVVAIMISAIDTILLFNNKEAFQIKRETPGILSLGDEQNIHLQTKNLLPFETKVVIIDELPYQLQERNFRINLSFKYNEKKNLEYTIAPKTRGEYVFDNINVFISTRIGFIRRRLVFPQRQMVKVYPSVIQMKNMELKAFSSISLYQGVKRIRKIGHSYEFDHIKNYVIGDDSRSINWKASGRKADLMVNHYEDERSQHIYSVIDKSRSMKTPFNGLSLLDYAINTSLVISNISLKKHDKAGLLTFSDKINTVIKSESKSSQLQRIMDALYNEKEHHLEANYELLYNTIRKVITRRSLLFLFTNFDSVYSMQRVFPILRRINRFHLLVVVFFKDSEMSKFIEENCEDTQDIYHRVIGQKLLNEKEQIIHELNKFAIHSILTEPEHLSLNTVNKYLEFKAKGLI